MNGYYLDIPRDYCKPLGGLRWSALAEAIETDDGSTFALTPQLLAFLEGFASQRPLIHFGHILHFFYLLRQRKTVREDFTSLAMAWQEAGRPARTTGLVCALLCREVENAPNPPQLEELAGWLTVWARVSVRPIMPGDEPELEADLFESLVAVELASYSSRDLLHWFRHGAAPLADEGESLARDLLADKPRSLAELLALVSQHDRLSGAVPFVSSLIGGLSLPPRHQESPEIPLGGYADVTTKGRHEAILAAQFALDEWEFLRRFAQNELLYFRREDPAVRAREDLVLLLDQGVRTWGGVRVLLAAAVFALGQMAHRRELSLRLALTSSGSASFDPREMSPDELADRLGQSDLSSSPTDALVKLLQEETSGPRNIVLLTHPLNRDEPGTLAACAGLGADCRLFALTADAGGNIDLSELRSGGIVPISRCRVDLDRAIPTPHSAPAPTANWSGDIEPIGYPFRFGLAGHHDPLLFAFDQDGDWILVVSHPGTLLVQRTDGSAHEILPRPMLRGKLLGNFTSAIGVEGGFVLTAVFESRPTAAFYHLQSRLCRVIEFPIGVADNLRWRYLRRQYALAVISGNAARWIRLGSVRPEEPLPAEDHWPAPTVATLNRLYLSGQEVDPSQKSHVSGRREISVYLDATPGEIRLHGATPPWVPFTPTEEGRPLFKNQTLVSAEFRHPTLAVLVTASHSRQLWLFEGPDGASIGHLDLTRSRDQFTLSPDGQLLAVQRGHGQLQVRAVGSGLGVRCVTPVGRFHNNLIVELGITSLRLMIGQITCFITWRDSRLVATIGHPFPADELFAPARPNGPRPPAVCYDPLRFRASVRLGRLDAFVSSYGEVFIFDQGEKLVAGFFVFRHELAAWMPDGTRFGSERLLGHPPTPGADLRIGSALLAASRGTEGVEP